MCIRDRQKANSNEPKKINAQKLRNMKEMQGDDIRGLKPINPNQ